MPLSETKGKCQAKRNYCGEDYISDSSSCETKSLLRHMEHCRNNPNKAGKGQSLFSISDDKKLTYGVYSEERCRKAIARFIIKDEMPFRIVEKEGFREMVEALEPSFKVPSRWTISKDCCQLYLEEMRKLKKYFKKAKVRVSITIDYWTSIQNASYMCLTAHWIDDDWKLQKRILNFCSIDNHKGDTIGDAIETCFLAWGIDKIFTITVDNASANNSAITYLKRRLKSWDTLVLEGEFMHMRCAAHILNLIVSDGLKQMSRSIELIRHAVKYVKSSPLRLRKFKLEAIKERIESKILLYFDCPMRWNSTYLMLESAVKFIKVFNKMAEDDVDYKNYFKRKGRHDSSQTLDDIDVELGYEVDIDINTYSLPPSDYDWTVAQEFLVFLRLFYSMTLKFSGSNYVTSNTCFQHILAIHTSLNASANDSYSLLRDMTIRMQAKFDKYWGNMEKMNPLLVVAVILDPRYKVTYVEIAFEKLYPDVSKREATLKKVLTILHRLYDQYSFNMRLGSETVNSEPVSQPVQEQVVDSVERNMLFPDLEFEQVSLSTIDPTLQKFLATAKTMAKKHELVSEIDQYLQAELVGFNDPKFDILSWWKVNASSYQVLSLIARDLLVVPVSTVPSEFAFSTGGQVLDQFRSSLSPKMVEALVCAQNWLRTTPPCFNDLDVDNFDESFEQELSILNAISED